MEIDGTKPIIQTIRVYSLLYNNQMNARALIGQSVMVYCASKLMEVSPVFEEFVNHSPAAHDLRILLVFFQHHAWFISL